MAAEAKETPITLANPHLKKALVALAEVDKRPAGLMAEHFPYLQFGNTFDFKSLADTKFVLMGGSPDRARDWAGDLHRELKLPEPPTGIAPLNNPEWFAVYKVGPVIAASHGMGKASMSILLHELTKALAVAGAKGVTYIRVGTSGGVGVEGGTVVVTTQAVCGMTHSTKTPALQAFHRVHVLGKLAERPCKMNAAIAQAIFDARPQNVTVVQGATLSTSDFYEGQSRVDGAIATHTEAQKIDYIKSIHQLGVRNIEMEASCFSAFCTLLKIDHAIVCAALLNRLNGDAVSATPAELHQYNINAIAVVINYVKSKLKL